MILNATNGSGTLDALAQAGTASLNGKVLVDVSNPLDFSHGMPPSLFVSNTDSLAEQIQRAYPAAMVVKALNMVTAALMVDPRQLGKGDHTTFICGNSEPAKTRVSDLLVNFGWTDIIDLGDLSAARGMEMYLPLWLRMWGALGTGMINVKVVR
jgi:predicted dinucleotide-binding enzyme